MDLVALTEELIKALAVNKEAVSVKEFPSDEDNIMLIQVMVDSEDIGRVIGKSGKNANADFKLILNLVFTYKKGYTYYS